MDYDIEDLTNTAISIIAEFYRNLSRVLWNQSHLSANDKSNIITWVDDVLQYNIVIPVESKEGVKMRRYEHFYYIDTNGDAHELTPNQLLNINELRDCETVDCVGIQLGDTDIEDDEIIMARSNKIHNELLKVGISDKYLEYVLSIYNGLIQLITSIFDKYIFEHSGQVFNTKKELRNHMLGTQLALNLNIQVFNTVIERVCFNNIFKFEWSTKIVEHKNNKHWLEYWTDMTSLTYNPE